MKILRPIPEAKKICIDEKIKLQIGKYPSEASSGEQVQLVRKIAGAFGN